MLINRQDAIEAVMDLPDCENGYSNVYDKACIIGLIEEVPSAQRKGKWIPFDYYPHEAWECDQCGCIYEVMMNWTPDYCPNCGADMRPDNAPLVDDDSIYG